MVELILSEKNDSGHAFTHMPLDSFRRISDILKREKMFNLNLRVDFSSPHPDFSEILDSLIADKFELAIYLSDIDAVDLRIIDQLIASKGQIILSLGTALAKSGNQKDGLPLNEFFLNKYSNTAIFVPIASPHDDLDIICDSLEKIPSRMNFYLGVGWKDYYSGPSLMDRDDSAAWAGIVHSLLSRLFDQSKSALFLCGLPQCFFPTEKLGAIARIQKTWPISHCRPELSVHVDGGVSLCSKADLPPEMNIIKENSILSINENYYAKVKKFSEFCDFSDDLRCQRISTESCGGICLKFSISEWKSYKRN